MRKDSTIPFPLSFGQVLEPGAKLQTSSIEINSDIVSRDIQNFAIQVEVNSALASNDFALPSLPKQELADNSVKKTLPKNLLLRKVANLVYASKRSKSYSLKTQTWQGYVVEIKESTFIAKLDDLTKAGGTYEMAEFELDEVSPGDTNLLKPGAIFYWSVGSSITNGQIKKESMLRFKRVAKWTEDDYDSAIDLANSWRQSITWD
jgi:hypothetical protein